ncbi:winged helix-turn-helix domain-containing protein [Aeromonas veronii]|uniref:winged helix-turn-helix domain-containing protein n=3 Tax=Aeromonas veronii TaxID=654 RepID=UPI001116EE7B
MENMSIMSVNIYFDPISGRIFSNSSEVGRLNYSERLVFELLIKEKNKIVPKDELLAAGWPGRVVVPNSLNIAIKSIRGTLERAGVHSEPETIPKMGYKLSVDIICIDSELDIPQQVLTHSLSEPANLLPEKNSDSETIVQNANKKSFHQSKLHATELSLGKIKSFIYRYAYYLYVSFVLLTSATLYLARIIAEPDFYCVEYGKSSFCGAHQISKSDIPSEFLNDDTEGTYWFTERDNEFMFIKVD